MELAIQRIASISEPFESTVLKIDRLVRPCEGDKLFSIMIYNKPSCSCLVLLNLFLILISAAGADTSAGVDVANASIPNSFPAIETALNRAKELVATGTHAGERSLSDGGTNNNYNRAKGVYQEAYKNFITLEKLGQTNNLLKARLFGEYGWFIYRTGYSPNEGTNLIYRALQIRPSDPNLNTKMAMLAMEHSSDGTAGMGYDANGVAQKFALRAIKTDSNYGYAYWILKQSSTNLEAGLQYNKQFLALTNHYDLELWLFEEKEFELRVRVAQQLESEMQKTNSK